MRVAALVAAVVAMTGLALGIGIPAAQAQTNYYGQFCDEANGVYECLNAWNGGPFVNVYTHLGALNNNFIAVEESSGDYFIQDVGSPTSWYGSCVGDAHNNSNYVYTSLDPCPGNPGSPNGGWGTNFTITYSGGSIAFHNNHWNGWLCPASDSNGSTFYLNEDQECFFGWFAPA